MTTATLLSIQVGLPQQVNGRAAIIGPEQQVWTTAFLKEAVAGPVWFGRTNIVGDAQASVKTHGGPDKAVCVYPWEHYAFWQRELELPELVYGALGENLTISGQREDECCVGDIVRIGEVVLQVSQPRPPCWRLARWWQRKEFAVLMERTGLTGWYCRVLKEGYAEAGAMVELLERPQPRWNVLRANAVLYGDPTSEDINELLSCEVLAETWRQLLAKRANGGR